MLPPCDPSILEHNPNFKRLYENLTTNILNPDGSTRAHSADPARKAIAEELNQCQIRSSKKRIKERILKQLAFASDSNLPDECHDNLAIISLYLETPPLAIEPEQSLAAQTPTDQTASPNPNPNSDPALSLLAPEFETFYTHLPSLAQQISTLISNAITELRSISSSNDNPDPLDDDSLLAHNPPSRTIPASRSASNHYARARARDRRVRTSMAPVPPLATQLRDRVQNLRNTQSSELPAARRAMAATAAELLAVRTHVLERTVVILERAKHGALARAMKAKAEHLATVAQGIEGKLEVTKLEIGASLYTPETLAALGRYRDHLRDMRGQLETRRSEAMEELKRYGYVEESEGGVDEDGSQSGPGATMAEIARRYGLLLREVDAARMEIARIGE